jgi:hypothetical protein
MAHQQYVEHAQAFVHQWKNFATASFVRESRVLVAVEAVRYVDERNNLSSEFN